MTEPERKVARAILNDRRRSRVDEQGGYEIVEKDARHQELLIDRRCRRGKPTYAELEAENAELRRLLKLSYNRTSTAKKSLVLARLRMGRLIAERDQLTAEVRALKRTRAA